MSITKQQIIDALSSVKMSGRGGGEESDIVSLGMVSDPFITTGDAGSKVMFSLTVPADRAEELEPLREEAQAAVEAIAGVASAMVALTAERKPGSGASGAAPRRPAPPNAPAGPGGTRPA